VRALIIRLTSVTATLAGLLSAAFTAASQAPWPVILSRALTAFAIVASVGFVFGLILMRTALRRHYEQHRDHGPGPRRARGER
jgi:hypothetical protein